MDLLDQFKQHWAEQFPHLPPGDCRLLLAVSGGVDSVVLVDLAERSGFDFTIAHCNFQLRGEESHRDEQFVRELGAQYKKHVYTCNFDTRRFADTEKISIQEAARVLRYQWFDDLLKEIAQPAYVLTAHHGDDNIETVLMHFFRGTGINGLAGIAGNTGSRRLLRPLLRFRKQELLDYATDRQLRFVEDSSNASDKYTRNFFRNSLLPQIKEIFPQVEENILQNIERMQEVAAIYRHSVEQTIGKLLEKKGTEFHVPVLKWKKASPLQTITWELIKPFGFHAAQTAEVIKLLDASNGAHQDSSTHRIIRNRNWMIITPMQGTVADHLLVEEGQQQVQFRNGMLSFEKKVDPQIETDSSIAMLDARNIVYPLIVRPWKTGDYFYPLGMHKKKKLNRFFIDLKLSRTDKEKVWVVESNHTILWVIGYRIDDRYRVTDQTKEVLKIRLRL